ncbi:phosphotransferase [Streptosporangium algeriense]|uniref:Phosphotransferase n=1 Tax=Streptosporangium algeriense TaxID=1682748 RepID=A0ABW3DGK2_9ACTN
MIAIADPRLTFARQALGPVDIVSMSEMPPDLLVLADVRDSLHVVKRHADLDRFQREAHAYATWIPHLRDLAPRMVAADPATRSLLLTMLPGKNADRLPPGSSAERRAHRSAGAALRELHRVLPVRSDGAVPAYLAGRVRWWAGHAYAADLISTPEHRTLLTRADTLATSTMDGAVCHLDYQPRN